MITGKKLVVLRIGKYLEHTTEKMVDFLQQNAQAVVDAH
jgi:hypothetical protein